jgi:nitric oxide reductase large subunit
MQQHRPHAPNATTATTNHHDSTSANLLLLLIQCSMMLWHILQVLGHWVKVVVQDGVAVEKKGCCRGPG